MPDNDPFFSPVEPPLGLVVRPATLREFYIGCGLIGLASSKSMKDSEKAARAVALADSTIAALVASEKHVE